MGELYKGGERNPFVKRFYDIAFLDVHPLANLYHRVFLNRDIVLVPPNRKEGAKVAREAKKNGKVPIGVATKPNELKELIWIKDLFALFSIIPVDEPSIHVLRQHEVPLGIFYTRGEPRVWRHNIRVALEREVPVLAASGARRASEVRAPRDAAALLTLLGMSKPQALAALSVWWERW